MVVAGDAARTSSSSALRSSESSGEGTGGRGVRRRVQRWSRRRRRLTEEVGGEVEVAVAFGRRRWRRSGGFRARASARGGADERGGYGGDLKWRLGGRGGEVRQQWCGGGAQIRRGIGEAAEVLGAGKGVERVEGESIYRGGDSWRRG